MQTHYSTASEILAQIETQNGCWTEYGNDGRATTRELSNVDTQTLIGPGWRARFKNNLGLDYGWGPQAQSENEAIMLLLAEEVATLREMLSD